MDEKHKQQKITANDVLSAITKYFRKNGYSETPVRPKFQSHKRPHDGRFMMVVENYQPLIYFNRDGYEFDTESMSEYPSKVLYQKPETTKRG